MNTYEVSVTRVTYYKVKAASPRRAADLAFTPDDMEGDEYREEVHDETTGHIVYNETGDEIERGGSPL